MVISAQEAIKAAQSAELAYCKFITANDTGDTGGHQSGFHLHKNSWPLAFDEPGKKGSNKDTFVTIKWQGDFETNSRIIYYGTGTRDEYRLTRFGKGFPFLNEENIGNLLVIAKRNTKHYEAFVLDTEDDMESFFSAFGISATEVNRIIDRKIENKPEDQLLECFARYITSTELDFPTTQELSSNARACFMSSYGVTKSDILRSPDKQLLAWISAEYSLFKEFEKNRYGTRIKSLFKSVQELIEFSNSILQRRKSRAGYSLEHHLAHLFRVFATRFSLQGKTEENKRPDFLFPSIEDYHNSRFDPKKLTFLASKTTCKDRWRQILNEADRIRMKHLFTLQQGISQNQLTEMYKSGVRLVVPKDHLETFPREFRERILTIESLMTLLGSRQ